MVMMMMMIGMGHTSQRYSIEAYLRMDSGVLLVSLSRVYRTVVLIFRLTVGTFRLYLCGDESRKKEVVVVKIAG